MELYETPKVVISLTHVSSRGFRRTGFSLIFHFAKRTDVILEIRRRKVNGVAGRLIACETL